MFRLINFTVIALFLSACSVGPDYVRPADAIPAHYKEIDKNNKKWKIAIPQDSINRGAWWEIFNDPTLNTLETQLNTSNQTIAAAKENYMAARALADEARASFFPTVSASATITRQKQNTANITSVSTNNPSNSHALLLDASWEPDIWGGTRRSYEAAEASAEAQAAQFALARLSAQATLAQLYFELRALDTDQRLLDQTVADNQKLLELTKNRYMAGVAALSDMVQAQSQVETAQAQAINNGITRSQYEHAIAVLIGQMPSSFNLNPSPLPNKLPPVIPLQIPSTLLERRPDIAAAEREVKAANANIGVAVSAFYPNLNLSASGGFQNTGLSQWFSLPSLVWSLGPTLAETIIDGGQRIAATKAAQANYEAAVANYRQTVLSAFQEVEDNLAALRILNEEAGVQNKAAANARLALQLVTNQYKVGTAAYPDVLTAQLAAFTAEKNAADINGLRMSTTVGLIKALGGGWNNIAQ